MSISLYTPDGKFTGVVVLDRATEAQTQAEIRKIEDARHLKRGELEQRRKGREPVPAPGEEGLRGI